MGTLNKPLSADIGFEQPVATPSIAGGLAGIASSLIASQPKPKGPSASDKQGALLRPFAERLESLRGSNLTDQQFLQQARKLGRQYAVDFPQFNTEINGLLSNYGVTSPSDIYSPRDTLIDNVSSWSQETTSGQLALIESQVINKSGQVDMESTLNNLTVAYQEDLADKARLERTAQEMELVTADNKVWKTRSDTAIGKLIPSWTSKTTKQVESLTSLALSGDPDFDTVEEQLAFLRQTRTTLYNQYVSDAQGANLHQSVYSGAGESNILAALKPIDNLLAQVKNQADDIGVLYRAYENAQKQDSLEKAVEVYGSIAVNPEFQRQVFTSAAQVYDVRTKEFLKGLSEQTSVGGLTLFDADSPAALAAVQAKIEAEVEAGTAEKGSIISAASDIQSGVDTADHVPAAKTVTSQYRMLTAVNSLLSPSALNRIFNPAAVNKVTTLISKGDEFSLKTKESLLSFAAAQVRMNSQVIKSTLAASQTYTVEKLGNNLVLKQNGVVLDEGSLSVGDAGGQDLFKAVKNINMINSTSRRILGIETPDPSTILPRGTDENTQEIQDYLNSISGGDGVTDAEGSEGVDQPSTGAFTGVSEAGAGYTIVTLPDGTAQRREGTRAWRNNNPGNIEFGDFAKSHGAVGTDGRFAVFPTYSAGRNAKQALLFDSKGYRGKTLSQAIHRYAPPVENNTALYISRVAKAIGVSPDVPLSSLTGPQRETMLDAMEAVEGFKEGTIDGVSAPPVQRNLPEVTGIQNVRPFSRGSATGVFPEPLSRPTSRRPVARPESP